jgi:hypothetical protein
VLTQTLCHLPAIDERAEARFWLSGITGWQDALAHPDLRPGIERSLAHLDAGEARPFAAALPNALHWRLFPEFRHTLAYLDIETTGGRPDDEITAIALYDGRTVRCYVNGDNLHRFVEDVRDYQVLVTYNGKCFDVPFIQRFFGIRLDQVHIDLRYVLASLGLKGGLKGCEKQVGIDRGDLDGLDGYFAVLLWREYVRRREARVLETLLAYNVQDVLSLEVLLTLAYNRKLTGSPFETSHTLLVRSQPANPYRPDAATVERLRVARA